MNHHLHPEVLSVNLQLGLRLIHAYNEMFKMGEPNPFKRLSFMDFYSIFWNRDLMTWEEFYIETITPILEKNKET